MKRKQPVPPLTYGELMRLCQGHGTSRIYARHCAVVQELQAQVEALQAKHEHCMDCLGQRLKGSAYHCES